MTLIRKEVEKTVRSDINIMFERVAPNTERGSPSPAVRTGGNLVGRGIANPMSERTRGFEMSRQRKS